MPDDFNGIICVLGIPLLVAFIIYRCIRHVIGYQLICTLQLWMRIGIFTLIGCLAYRFLGAYILQRAAALDQPPPRNAFAHTFDKTFTIGLFFITAGYYIFYYLGVIFHFQQLEAATDHNAS
jgi:hypothetical protein